MTPPHFPSPSLGTWRFNQFGKDGCIIGWLIIPTASTCGSSLTGSPFHHEVQPAGISWVGFLASAYGLLELSGPSENNFSCISIADRLLVFPLLFHRRCMCCCAVFGFFSFHSQSKSSILVGRRRGRLTTHRWPLWVAYSLWMMMIWVVLDGNACLGVRHETEVVSLRS